MTTIPTSGPYQIQRLLPRHFRILEMKLAGYTNVEIAEAVGCTRETVYVVSRSPLFQAELNRKMKEQTDGRIQEDRDAFVGKARSLLEGSTEKAAATQIDLLDCEDDSVRLRASGSILDRVLGKSEAPAASAPSTSIQINAADAQLLVVALKESSDASNPRTEEDAITNGSPTSPPKDE